MKCRVGVWASVGFLIALFWALYLFPTGMAAPEPMLMLARITCPAAFASSILHVGIRLSWVVLANTVAYACVGSIVEALRYVSKAATQS